MSILTIQVGQCGNQTGAAFFNELYEEALRSPPALSSAILNTYFNFNGQKHTAKAVLVDMEPKVVNACLSQNKEWIYDPSAVFCKQEGSGNNWAFGYNVHGAKSKEKILNKIRKQLEVCDVLQGMLLYMSLAGGTGSGVGTCIAEAVQEEFDANLLSIAVWPYSFGEVILQNYNTALTLSHLVEAADGILLLENNWLYQTAISCLNVPKPDFTHINKLSASVLTSAFTPIIRPRQVASYSQFGENPLCSVYRNLCSSTGFPFLDIITTPLQSDQSIEFSNDTWSTLVKRCSQMLLTNTSEPSINWNLNINSPKRNKVLSSISILRGRESNTADLSSIPAMSENWTNFPYAEYRTDIRCGSYEKRMTVINNSQAILEELDGLIDKTFRMSQSGAYLHHYNKFGIETSHFFEYTFPCLEQVIANYASL